MFKVSINPLDWFGLDISVSGSTFEHPMAF